MPIRNSVKTYLENTYYHVYNKGIENREIFLDDQDYRVLLSYVKRYLTTNQELDKAKPRWKHDISQQIKLSAYCLMPNHFHFLVKQKNKSGITMFMRALMNSYVRYFNTKYNRNGGLFQGRFKAVHVLKDEYLIHLSRYIHINPLDIKDMNISKLKAYYSSYGDYIGMRNTEWIYKDEIMSHFMSELDQKGNEYQLYQNFIEDYSKDSLGLIKKLILE